MIKMRNPFNSKCKTKKEMLKILIQAHLSLPILDSDYFPDDLTEKRRELENLMLKYIWKWCAEVAVPERNVKK